MPSQVCDRHPCATDVRRTVHAAMRDEPCRYTLLYDSARPAWITTMSLGEATLLDRGQPCAVPNCSNHGDARGPTNPVSQRTPSLRVSPGPVRRAR
eukprot:10950505-Alexandrium_andersonii.AAC.1